MEAEISRRLKHNFSVNILDGAFFGFSLGFASFTTIIPLFISYYTNSAILIGLIPAIHTVGWQIPQLLNANRVSQLRVLRPYVLFMTIQERLPFLGLALVAWISPHISTTTVLLISYIILIWQGLGAGLTANPWQSMIGKLIPSDKRATFLGLQSSAANVMASIGAVFAGLILERIAGPLDFTLCFLLAFAGMVISYFFIALTREPPNLNQESNQTTGEFWKSLGQILRTDPNFRWFLVVRMLSPFATMGYAFYTVYAVKELGMSELTVGFLTSVLLATQVLMNPLMGWFGDHWSHRGVMVIGILACIVSSLVAWWAAAPIWFYLVVIMAGISNVAIWTIGIAMTQEFGNESKRPAYIGLANTLVAPFSILGPLLGGILADNAGYPAAFIASAFSGIITVVILQTLVKNPRAQQRCCLPSMIELTDTHPVLSDNHNP